VKKKNFTLGLVFVLAFAILYWGINFLKGMDIFSTNKFYYIEYSDINGLLTASPVNLNGYKIGQVTDIQLKKNDPSKLIVKIIIAEKIGIPENTVAKIVNADLLGSKAIELKFGNSTKILNKGSFLIGELEIDLMNELSNQLLPLKDKIESIINTVDTLLIGVNKIFNEDNQKNIEKSFKSLALTLESIESQRHKISSSISNIESITSNIKDNNAKLNNIINNFSEFSDSLLLSNIKSTIANADKTMLELKEITEKINRGEGTAGKLVNDDSLYFKLSATSKELELLLEDIRKNPSKYINIRVFGK